MTNKTNMCFFGDYYVGNETAPELSQEILQLIQNSHFSSCNFEAPIWDGKPNLDSLQPKAGPHIWQKTKALDSLKKWGIQFVSLANNHIFDLGKPGFQNSIDALQNAGIAYSGASLSQTEGYSSHKFSQQNTSFAVLCLAEAEFGVNLSTSEGAGFNWIHSPIARKEVRKLASEVDILIVQAHAGVEEINLPLPEWRSCYRELIDLGAKVVVGHHPHVTQGFEEYHSGLIAYSLGNFVFNSQNSFALQTLDAAMLNIEFDQSSISKYELLPLSCAHNLIEIDRSEDAKAELNRRNKMLASEKYEEEVNQICLDLWNTRYKAYYKSSLNSLEKSDFLSYRAFKNFLRSFLKTPEAEKNLLLLHNIRIESHRYAVQRALSLLTGVKI